MLDRSRINVDSVGRVQVTLSLDSSSPFGHRHTAERPPTTETPDLPPDTGARRQMWEQRSWSQGLGAAGWESTCSTWREWKETWTWMWTPGGVSISFSLRDVLSWCQSQCLLLIQKVGPVSSAEPSDLCRCSCQLSGRFFSLCRTRRFCHWRLPQRTGLEFLLTGGSEDYRLSIVIPMPEYYC